MTRPRLSIAQEMREQARQQHARLTERLDGVEPPLTARQREVFEALFHLDAWVTPMMVGGENGSHHSNTLRSLVRRGLVERKRRAGWVRPSYLYRSAS